ncbi:MAG: succinyl-diaminopimelate desuccinylase [Pseudomonadales bacterium]|nr:succinyl-diaminopimelate desuccinylase [Pseudomonadales bacterium]
MSEFSPAELNAVVVLAEDLLSRPSVTPEDAGCQQLIGDQLSAAGFTVEHMRFGKVDNIWARHGDQSPLFVFLGHTDVVPVGDEAAWDSPPFTPTFDGTRLTARGAADMKGSVAAMIIAMEKFAQQYPGHIGSMAMLLTADEEGPAVDGTIKVIEALQQRGDKIDWCLVGEPSSTDKVGDVVKAGRRGSLGATLTVKGIQGHVAYPHLADNPIHAAAPMLAKLATERWDEGNEFFPATSFQISNINSGTGATNVIPNDAEVVFNFRFSTEQTPELLITRTEKIFAEFELNYEIDWTVNGMPFLTSDGPLVDAVVSGIKKITGLDTELSTAGGTSDGRFVAPTGASVVELGPCNATIHKVNEWVDTDDLKTLTEIYYEILRNLLAK